MKKHMVPKPCTTFKNYSFKHICQNVNKTLYINTTKNIYIYIYPILSMAKWISISEYTLYLAHYISSVYPLHTLYRYPVYPLHFCQSWCYGIVHKMDGSLGNQVKEDILFFPWKCGSPKNGIHTQNGWYFFIKKPITMDDLGLPYVITTCKSSHF